MKVGQKVYIKPRANAARRSSKIKVCHISKVGRKYFEVKEMPYKRFFISTMLHDGGAYVSEYKCYLSQEDIDDEQALKELSDEFYKMSSGEWKSLGVTSLKRIKNIIDNGS